MAWFDEEEEDQSGPLAVARAMSSDEESAVPAVMPGTTNKTQPVGKDPGTSVAAGLAHKDEEGAQSLAAYPEEQGRVEEQPAQAQQNTVEASSPEEAADQELSGLSSMQPIKPPTAPTLQRYSNAPIESAQELAKAKGEFANKVAAGAYKPSIGRRIGASVAAGLIGFGSHNAAAGIAAGQGMKDRPLNNARRIEEARESGIQSQIDAGTLGNQRVQQENANDLANYNLQEHDFRNQAYATHQNALAQQEQATARARQGQIAQWTPNDPANPYAGGTGTTAAGKTLENVPPPPKWIQEWSKSPAGQAATARMTVQTRKQLAADIGLKPGSEDFTEFVANGKVARQPRTTIHVPSAEQSKYNDWKVAFKRDNGRDPNAAEISTYGHAASGSMPKSLADRIASQKNMQISEAEADYKKGLIDKDEYLDRWQNAQDSFEERVQEASGNDVPHVKIRDNVDPNTLQWHGQAPTKPQGGNQSGPAAAAPAAAQKPAAPSQGLGTQIYKTGNGQSLKPGSPVTVNGKKGTYSGNLDKNGKPIINWGS